MQDINSDVTTRTARERQWVNALRKSFQPCLNRISGMRSRHDQTTLWATISSAGTPVNVFQKSGLRPQMKKAAAPEMAPEIVLWDVSSGDGWLMRLCRSLSAYDGAAISDV